MLLLVQILILTIFVSTGSNEIDTNRRDVPALPVQAVDQPYYNQLSKGGNCYTKDHHWLKNGNNHIQVGKSYFSISAIGDAISFISPVKTGYLSLIKQSNGRRKSIKWLVFVEMNPYKADYNGLITRFEWR